MSAAAPLSPAHRLPSELWDAILFFVPPSQLQATALALLAVLPKSRVSIANLFRHITISNDRQLKALLAKLSHDGLAIVQKDPDTPYHGHLLDISAIPRSFALRSWRLVDNNILINIINILASNLRVIDLFIGPMFGPDQLEDLFLKPKTKLELLSLRFNQNVSRRSYEPFLKGAYFDSCCDLLAKWPASASFRSLSFVQDLPPPYQKSNLLNDGIAQPIILFRFWCITALAASPIGRHLRHLRLRIPARNLGVPLTNSAAHPQLLFVGGPSAEFRVPGALFPSLEFLDISTSFLPSVSSGVALILKRYPTLKHLVLDRTQQIVPCRFEGDEERVLDTVRAIGSSAAASGVSRAVEVARLWRDLHKLVETEIAQARRRANRVEDHASQDSVYAASRAEPGTLKPKKRGRSAYASAPRAKTSVAPASPVASSSAHPVGPPTDSEPLEHQALPAKLVVLPSTSRLLSICCGTELPRGSTQGTRAEWKRAFEAGWTAGLQRHEEAVLERLAEYERSMDVWRKSVAQQAGEGDEEARQRVLGSRPRLVHQQGGGQTCPSLGLDGCVGQFMEAMALVETEPAKAHAELALYKTRAPPAFCTVPDCAAVGRVAWVPSLPVPLLRNVAPKSEDALRAKMDSLNMDNDQNLYDTNTAEGKEWGGLLKEDDDQHVEGCGHIVGQKIWSEDNW